MSLNKKIDAAVEAICQKGCQAVRDDIALISAGKTPVEIRNLTADERKAVHQELQSIMAVYGDACRVDDVVKKPSAKRDRLINDCLLPACPES